MKAVFLDRDGVINEDFGYVGDYKNFKFKEGIFELLRLLQELGFELFVVTNQSGIARGFYKEENFHLLMDNMIYKLKREGINIRDYNYCPHHPEITGECDCRKPKPKMILDLAQRYKIDLRESIMIGDKDSDIEACKRAKLKRCFKVDGELKDLIREIKIEFRYTDIDFNNKTILITGGAGFIGSNLAHFFQKNFPKSRVIVFDKFRDGERFENGNLKSLGHFKNLLGFNGIVISGDITKKDDLKMLDSYKIDYIFHQAAISDTTVSNQKIMLDTNLNSFKNILDIAVKNGATLVYASSAATYGDSKIFKVGYEKPNNIYGFSKLMMDNLARDYMGKVKTPIVGLRYFNVYGEREFFKGKTASMVLQFGLQLLRGERAKLFKGSDRILRDFIYIEDIIQANLKALTPKESGIYNVGTGRARSFQDIVDILKRELDIKREDEYIENPYKDQYQFFTEADITKTKENLGYKPNFTLEEGIKRYLPEIKRIFKEELK